MKYIWTLEKPDGSVIPIGDLNSATANFTPLIKGTYKITLIVYNWNQYSDPLIQQIEVTEE